MQPPSSAVDSRLIFPPFLAFRHHPNRHIYAPGFACRAKALRENPGRSIGGVRHGCIVRSPLRKRAESRRTGREEGSGERKSFRSAGTAHRLGPFAGSRRRLAGNCLPAERGFAAGQWQPPRPFGARFLAQRAGGCGRPQNPGSVAGRHVLLHADDRHRRCRPAAPLTSAAPPSPKPRQRRLSFAHNSAHWRGGMKSAIASP